MRQRSVLLAERNRPVLRHIQALKKEHPLWGYRRVWAYLKYRMEMPVNKKRIYRLMKEHNLLVTKNHKLRAKRTGSRPKPRAVCPNQYWGIDMTKIKLAEWGWIYLVAVLDWYTKEIVGYSVRSRSKTSDWLDALYCAVDERFPEGIRDSKANPPFLISDNGCQPTSVRFMESCSDLGIRQIFTSWSNPKGNADTERVMRTIKEDLVWTHEWDTVEEFKGAFAKWVIAYNTDYPHQSLDYKTPQQRHENYIAAQPRLLKNALA